MTMQVMVSMIERMRMGKGCEHESREEAQELFTSSYRDWDRLKLGILLD